MRRSSRSRPIRALCWRCCVRWPAAITVDLDRLPGRSSPGQRCRAEVARALAVLARARLAPRPFGSGHCYPAIRHIMPLYQVVLSGGAMPEDRHGADPPGLWLRRRRESAGLTQEELAEHAGLATRTVSNLESHRSRRPHSRSLLKLAGALGLSSRASDELLARFRLDFADETVRCQPDGAPAAVPRQLPSTVPSLVGRSAEIAQLDQWLAEARQYPSGPAIFGIGGMAGVGKTALALCWAH